MQLSHLIQQLEKRLPLALQEKWDQSGLNLGSPSARVRSVLFAYDVCRETIAEAKKKRCGLLVSHHPFRLKADVQINLDNYEGRIIQACLKNNIALYACHTNHDASADSLNFHYLKKMGIKNIKPLQPVPMPFFKLAVFVPHTHTQKVMNALFAQGAGGIGNYSECSFRSAGTGTFRGNESSHPALGRKGKREEVKEDKVEVLVREDLLSATITAMKQAHPYEEAACDVYAIKNKMDCLGLGAWGTMPRSVSKTEFIQKLKRLFKTRHVRFVPSNKPRFQTVGICTGSGASLIDRAIQLKLDLLITGDVKYHQAIHAKRHNLAITDVGHFYSERESVVVLKNVFQELFGKNLKYHLYTKLRDAFETI